MKMKMLVASGLCLALTFPVLAQETKLLDSVYITPFAGSKIVLVGKTITKLLKENNLEVLKNKFIEDYRESAKDKDFPAQAKNVIYLASQDGRRRLKAMPDEDMPLNIENEIKSFKNDLPSFHYTIYDLTKAFEYHIYVSSPDNLEQLYAINYTTVFTQTAADNPVEIKRYSSIAITPTATGYNISRLSSNRKDYLILAPVFGISVINSSITPAIGFDINIQTQTKYGKPNYKIGIGVLTNVFADYKNKEFSNFYSINSYDIHYLKNVSHSKEAWLGFSSGIFSSGKLFGSAQNGSLDNAWKFGIVSQFKSLGIEWNGIRDRNKNDYLAITLKYIF